MNDKSVQSWRNRVFFRLRDPNRLEKRLDESLDVNGKSDVSQPNRGTSGAESWKIGVRRSYFVKNLGRGGLMAETQFGTKSHWGEPKEIDAAGVQSRECYSGPTAVKRTHNENVAGLAVSWFFYLCWKFVHGDSDDLPSLPEYNHQ
ncbi:hypothetical protein AVEN_268393-1 [Araneus ventricosus]|uniref:Uncharacterized protein n=1 Tax=Araneus ventricosus TaxID=182803 RepID=A0A4Y2DWP3_ARAVE|nr:hypothetical protein AVEN_268393-1 [Araneus ventricosus]